MELKAEAEWGGGGGGKKKIFLHNICCIEYIHVDVFNRCV